MKYQYTINNKVLFETNDMFKYIDFIKERPQALQAVLVELLKNSEKYQCNLATH